MNSKIIKLFFFLLLWSTSFGQVNIKMTKENGVYYVPCKINGLPLKFVFDTGASDVSISLTEAVFMLKNGYLDIDDIGESVALSIANGDVIEGTKINIIDTPGHADFGGEVERVLKMADGVILLVDAFEGPMPQTRFVLQKALQLNLHPIVVINKVDKPNCRPDEVHDAVFELFFNLDATEEQLNFPTFYGSGKNGWFNDSLTPTEDIIPLMDGIIKYVPEPKTEEGTLQLQITSLDYSSFLGRIAIGKVARNTIKENQPISLMMTDGTIKKQRVKELYVFEGMGKRKVTEVHAGDLCAVVGIEDFNIGDTIADFENPEALPVIHVDEPTMSMLFSINNSPFFGRDGNCCSV